MKTRLVIGLLEVPADRYNTMLKFADTVALPLARKPVDARFDRADQRHRRGYRTC